MRLFWAKVFHYSYHENQVSNIDAIGKPFNVFSYDAVCDEIRAADEKNNVVSIERKNLHKKRKYFKKR